MRVVRFCQFERFAMKSVFVRIVKFLAIGLTGLSCAVLSLSAAATNVKLQTSQGIIEIELYDTQAPITVANFLRYVRSGAYNNSFFHRSVSGFVIQSGGYTWNEAGQTTGRVNSFGAIQNEFSASRSNLRGTVAMAKLGGDPNSATSEWFINLTNNSAALDGQNGGFTVFGKVTDASLAVVDAIAAVPRFQFADPFAEIPLVNYTSGSTVRRANLVMINRAATKTVAPGAIDIDGDGRHQILVRNTSGMVAQSRVGRLVNDVFQFTSVDDPGANFRLAGVLDADANGKSDLVFLNTAQGDRGDVFIWNDFNRATERLWRSIRTVWDVQATGDFDGDGRDDVVWRFLEDDPRDTGVSFIWFQEGVNPQSATSYLTPGLRKRGGAPLSWRILGAADLNGDGAADLVYLSPDFQIRVLMATAQRTCANFSAGLLPAGVSVLGLGDFTGSGQADVLIRSTTTGVNVLRPLTALGTTLPPFVGNPDDPLVSCTSSTQTVTQSSSTILSADTSWRFYAKGDFNGDGTTDIVWLRPNGQLTVWLMQGLGVSPRVIDNAGNALSGFTVFQTGGGGTTYTN
jgi:cyclophilin family peptidyl-prolyl cis-trans isomerase